MKVRRFIRPFVFGSKFTLGAGSRANLVRHDGKDQGRIIFDGLHWNRGTFQNEPTRFITDLEPALDLNSIWGACEGGLRIPILGDADASRPFFLDVEDTINAAQAICWYLLGYIGGDIIEDDGFFEPPRDASHFCVSSVRGGVSCAQNVMQTILSFRTPNVRHGIRVTRIDLYSNAAQADDTIALFMNGPGLEPYKNLSFMAINSFAEPHWLPMIAKLEPLRDYTISVLRTQIASSVHGAAIHGWAY